jgi:hypothetical protein
MADPVPAGSDVSVSGLLKRLVAPEGTAPVTPQARFMSGLITKRRVGWL